MIWTKSSDPTGELLMFCSKLVSFFDELSIWDRTATKTESLFPKTLSADSFTFLKKVTESFGNAPELQADSE